MPRPSASQRPTPNQNDATTALQAPQTPQAPPYARHPYSPTCRLQTLLVNFRYHGQSPRHPLLPDHHQLSVCACRSVSHVWGLFATQVAAARIHTPTGPPIATDPDASSYRIIYHCAVVAAVFNPRYPIWIFVVSPSNPPARRNRQHRRHRRHHNRHHRHHHRHRRDNSGTPRNGDQRRRQYRDTATYSRARQVNHVYTKRNPFLSCCRVM